MAKDDLTKLGQIGQEIPGDDLTGDFDPLDHEASQIPLEELERQIDAEFHSTVKRGGYEGLEELADEMSETEDEDQGEGDEEQVEAKQDDDEEQEPKKAPEKKQQEKKAKPESDEDENNEVDFDEDNERYQSLERKLEMAQLRAEKAEQTVEQKSLLADRFAGEKGSLLQQLEELQRRASKSETQEDDDDMGVAERPRSTAPTNEFQKELNEFRTERIQRAIAAEGESFQRDPEVNTFLNRLKDTNGDEALAQFNKDFQERLVDHLEPIREAMFGNNPSVSAKLARSALRTAFADVRIAHLNRQEQEYLERRKAYLSKLKGDKNRSRSAKSKRGKPNGEDKKIDPVRMPLDELEDHLDRQYGVGSYDGREII